MSSATKFIDPLIHDIHSVHDSSIAENALCEKPLTRFEQARFENHVPLIQVVSEEKFCVGKSRSTRQRRHDDDDDDDNGISVISARITNDDDDDNNGNRVGRSRERVRRQCSSDLVEGLTSIATTLTPQHKATNDDDNDDDKDDDMTARRATFTPHGLGTTLQPLRIGVPYKTPKWA